jgi:hypothetical protein
VVMEVRDEDCGGGNWLGWLEVVEKVSCGGGEKKREKRKLIL